MTQNNDNNPQATHLARLIGEVPALGGAELWQRLDMERVARRLIQTARVAAAEHVLLRAQEAIGRRDQAAGAAGSDPSTLRLTQGPDRRTA